MGLNCQHCAFFLKTPPFSSFFKTVTAGVYLLSLLQRKSPGIEEERQFINSPQTRKNETPPSKAAAINQFHTQIGFEPSNPCRKYFQTQFPKKLFQWFVPVTIDQSNRNHRDQSVLTTFRIPPFHLLQHFLPCNTSVARFRFDEQSPACEDHSQRHQRVSFSVADSTSAFNFAARASKS